MMYRMAVLLHTFLPLLCNFSIFDGMLVLDIPRYDEDVKRLLSVFNFLKIFILSLPFPLLIVLVLSGLMKDQRRNKKIN